jgi:hypothetical protein
MDVKRDVNNFIRKIYNVIYRSKVSASAIVQIHTGLNPFKDKFDKKITLTRRQLRDMVHDSILFGYMLHSEDMEGSNIEKLNKHIYEELINKCNVSSGKFNGGMVVVKDEEILNDKENN